MNDENPLLYRAAQAQRRRPFWKKALAWSFYPAMMLLPIALSSSRSSLQLLLIFAHFLYFCGRPLMEAVSTLATEKQRGTYECLATTGFSLRRWVLTLLRLCTVPRLMEVALFGWILAAVPSEPWRTYGGPEPTTVVGIIPVVLYTASCVIFYAAVGLWISARSRTLAKAQLRAALFLGFTLFFGVVIDILLEQVIGSRESPFLSRFINPVGVTMLFWQGNSNGSSPWVIWAITAAQLGLAIGLATSVQHRLKRAESPSSRKPVAMTTHRVSRRFSHPILYREFLKLQSQPWAWLRMAGYPLILMSMRFVLPEFSRQSHTTEDTFIMAFFIHMIYTTVRATVAGSSAIAEERENRTWESLLSTRLTPLNLFSAQWVTRVLPAVLEPLPWIFLWAFFAKPLGGTLQPRALLGMLTYSFVWTTFVGTLALWNSSRCNSAAAALRATALTLSAIIFGGLLACVLSPDAADSVGFLSPALGIEAFFEDYHRLRALAGLALYVLSIPCLAQLSLLNIRSHKLA